MQKTTRERLAEAGRYSRFVALMRWALPAAAVVLGLVLLVWPNANGDIRQLPQTTMGVREMINPHYRGVNTKGDPVEIVAARALQAGTLEEVIDLETIEATLVRAEGGKVTLEAKTGRYDQKNNTVVLTGSVHIVDEKGYDVVTETATILLNSPAQAFGDQPVTGKGPQGNIRANGFRITDEGKTVMFTGRSRLELRNGVPQ